MSLPGLAWVKIESPAVEVDGRLEVLDIAQSGGHALDLLNLAAESLAYRVGLSVGACFLEKGNNLIMRYCNARIGSCFGSCIKEE